MPFETYLGQQLKARSAMEPQDVFKLCYQAARGAEHLLSDVTAARRYFYIEWERTDADGAPLWEPISPDFCRVNLGAWKATGLPAEWLFRLFAATAAAPQGEDLLPAYLEAADRLVARGDAPFSQSVWREALDAYRAIGMPAVHHSDSYRSHYAPAYRLVNRRLMRLLPILEEIAKRQTEVAPLIVAIDGRAAAGKTTLARDLSAVLDTATVHMDDFFLPPALRTEARLLEAGGNVHYERFREEVLSHLTRPDAFSYRVFDCGVMDFAGTRTVPGAAIRVVEGSYSHHPAFGAYAHVKVFATVGADEQAARILARNGAAMAERFRTEWIPREERYFEVFGIEDAAHVIV